MCCIAHIVVNIIPQSIHIKLSCVSFVTITYIIKAIVRTIVSAYIKLINVYILRGLRLRG